MHRTTGPAFDRDHLHRAVVRTLPHHFAAALEILHDRFGNVVVELEDGPTGDCSSAGVWKRAIETHSATGRWNTVRAKNAWVTPVAMRRPPEPPRARTGNPSSKVMVGVMLEVGRANGRGSFGPGRSVLTGTREDVVPAPVVNAIAAALVVKSSSSLLRMTPVVSVLTIAPNASLIVVVSETTLPCGSTTMKWVVPCSCRKNFGRGRVRSRAMCARRSRSRIFSINPETSVFTKAGSPIARMRSTIAPRNVSARRCVYAPLPSVSASRSALPNMPRVSASKSPPADGGGMV